MGLVLWFVGFIGLIVAAAVASGRGRASPNDVVGRGILGIAGAAYAAVVVAAVWTWGGTTAANGRADRLREGASASVTLHGMRMALDRTIAIGHGADADVRTPGSGATLLAQLDLETSSPARQAIIRATSPDAVVVAVAPGVDPATAATARGCASDRAAHTLPPGATIAVVECAGGKPVRAVVLHRDHARAVLMIAPLAWRGRFVPERLVVRAGDVLRVGGGDDAIPGVNTWDAIALRGSTAMLAVPTDPTDCVAWSSAPSPERSGARGLVGRCEVDAGAFVVDVLPLVPDAEQVVDRAARAAFVIGGPPLALVLALVVSRRRGRRAHVLARSLRLCVLGAGLTALGCWRLLWAYRVDVMRELATIGPRLVDNQLAVVAIGAALAGNAALALDGHDRSGDLRSAAGRRAAVAIAAWSAWLVAAWLAVGLGVPAVTAKTAGVLALSLAAALTPLAAGVAAAVTTRWLSRLGPDAALCAIAAGALAARFGAPRSALVKLGLAYATVLAGHAALRAAVARDTGVGYRLRVVVALAAAAFALASLDAGVALAVTGTGLALAMIVAGHDAMYDASQVERLGVLEREHARLLLVHGAAVIVLAVGVAAAALVASDRGLIEHGASAVLHAPLAIAALFGTAAIVARSHRRGWAPWLAAALAALAVWGARDGLLERATAGGGVGARRVAALVEPGYALLRDERAFAANVSAWREAALAPDAEVDPWTGQGYFGARIRDPGVARSIDNDYLPVLVAREGGVAGLTQGVALLLAFIVGAGVLASIRLGHASRDHRARWLVTAVAGSIAVYQPLAALGVLPLTGISWPGLGIDSPADLWLFVIGGVWCLMAGEPAAGIDDERVRQTPRLARARRVVIVALSVAGIAAAIVVARAGACALARVTTDDVRVDAALRYAASITCVWPERSAPEVGPPGSVTQGRSGPTIDDVVPVLVAGSPSDAATARFELELRAAWLEQRPKLLAALRPQPSSPPIQPPGPVPATQLAPAPHDADASLRHQRKVAGGREPDDDPVETEPQAPGPTAPAATLVAAAACRDRAGRFELARAGDGCTATLTIGWPAIRIAVHPAPGNHVRATCAVTRDDDVLAAIRGPARARPTPRIRVVSAAMGAAAMDAGELVSGARIVRLRAGAKPVELAALAAGWWPASSVAVGPGVAVELRPAARGVVLRGHAELFVAADGGAWRRLVYANDVVLDRITLIVAGPPDRRAIALFRPPRAWGGATVVDPLLADDTHRVGDRARRAYPYGAALAELGWVNPYDVERSVGLDGWIHAAYDQPAASPSCGTLAPPAVPRDRVCARSPLDGVVECRVSLQPELSLALRRHAGEILADPKPHTGRDVQPVRVAYVVLRGDTGELLAQGNVVPGRTPLAYAPANADAEAELVRLREQRGESDAERAEWNLPIAVGSTLKPIVARAAEQAFPHDIARLALSAAGSVGGCRARRGVAVSPILGHCPPTSLAGQPASADLHDFLARSPNWYQAALGLVGLALPDGRLSAGDTPVSLAEIAASDLASWPTENRLLIADATGPIVGRRGVSIAGLRRTPLWSRIEQLLGRPGCTLGDRGRCERAAARADVCAARALPIAAPGADLRYLVALGPDRIDLYADDRPSQVAVPVREYLQLLRGSGVHPIGSLAQLADAFGRVVYDPDARRLAASWFPSPVAGTLPGYTCADAKGHAATVLGADGGLCGVLREGGTAHATAGGLLAEPRLVVYGAKTGTIDSLAEIARRPAACQAWNERHAKAAQLACGKTPPDDSLFVIAFGVVTAKRTIPITLAIQLQRSGTGGAARVTPAFVRAIRDYLAGP